MLTLTSTPDYKIVLYGFKDIESCMEKHRRLIYDEGIYPKFYGPKEELLNMPEEWLLSILPVRYSKSYSKLGKDGCWHDTEPYPEELYNFRTKRFRKIISGHHLNPKIFTEYDSIVSATEVEQGDYYLIVKTKEVK